MRRGGRGQEGNGERAKGQRSRKAGENDMGLFTDGFKQLKKASEPLYRSPKSIQETIEIMAVAENGIFEVSRNKYSKCYRFCDINYTTATEEEQVGIFSGTAGS